MIPGLHGAAALDLCDRLRPVRGLGVQDVRVRVPEVGQPRVAHLAALSLVQQQRGSLALDV